MQTFKELCNGKVSTAIQAMIDGLYEMDESPSFRVNMNLFGYSRDNVCYGCAATCAVQKLTNVVFNPNVIDTIDDRSKTSNVERDDLIEFEKAIDHTRMTRYFRIWFYMGYCKSQIVHPDSTLYVLSNETTNEEIFWKDGLYTYQEYVDKLVKLGF